MHVEISPALRAVFKGWQFSSEVPAAYALRAKAITYVADGCTITETSSQLRLSRQTIYKWLRRYASGEPGWYEDGSRRPHRVPNRLPDEIEKKVISTVTALVSAG